MSWPTEAEQRRMAKDLQDAYPLPYAGRDQDEQEDEFAEGVHAAINLLLYREVPRRDGWEAAEPRQQGLRRPGTQRATGGRMTPDTSSASDTRPATEKER